MKSLGAVPLEGTVERIRQVSCPGLNLAVMRCELEVEACGNPLPLHFIAWLRARIPHEIVNLL